MKIYPLFKNTIHKEIRNKGLIFLTVMTVVVIMLSYLGFGYLQSLPVWKPLSLDKYLIVVFFSIIIFWTVLLTVILSTNLIRSDITSKVLSLILTFPIGKGEYLFSRMLGVSAIIFSYFICSFFLSILSLFSLSATPYFGSSLILGFFIQFLIIIIYMILTCIVSLFINKIFSLLMVSFLSIFFIFIDMFSIDLSVHTLNFSNILRVISQYLLPQIFKLQGLALNLMLGSSVMSTSSILLLVGHTVIIISAFFFLLKFLFRKRHF